MKLITLKQPTSRYRLATELTLLMTDEEFRKLDDTMDRQNWYCSYSVRDIELTTVEEVAKEFKPISYKSINSEDQNNKMYEMDNT